jgi:glycosyltransferase involved in cell wall biosynthesis
VNRPPAVTRIAIVYNRAPGVDAIDQQCRRLLVELAGREAVASYYADGLRDLSTGPSPTHVLLQYNPFRWGRSGFAPRLVRDVRRLRRGSNARIVLMVHEAWIDIRDGKSALIGAWQRAQLRTLMRLVDRVAASTEDNAVKLGGETVHIPPASTIEPVATTSAAARAGLGLDGRLVVTLFGRSNPSRALGYAETAVDALSRSRDPSSMVVQNLGADSPSIRVPAGVEQIVTGELAAAEISRRLLASDLILLPFTDGLTTRRSTLMSALAHARPVLALAGPRTDSVLRDALGALCLTPLGDHAAFGRAAVRLADDPDERTALGDAGQTLYRRRFDWPILADNVLSVLDLNPVGVQEPNHATVAR